MNDGELRLLNADAKKGFVILKKQQKGQNKIR